MKYYTNLGDMNKIKDMKLIGSSMAISAITSNIILIPQMIINPKIIENIYISSI